MLYAVMQAVQQLSAVCGIEPDVFPFFQRDPIKIQGKIPALQTFLCPEGAAQWDVI